MLDQLKLQNSSGQDAGLKKQRVKSVGAISIAALLLFVATQWPQRDSNTARAAAPGDGSIVETASPGIDYYPTQFGNPAPGKAPEEHIQAF
jgi:hypothetical protein